MKEKLNLKKVKIDEHIKAGKTGTNDGAIARKRGRPKKIGEPSHKPEQTRLAGPTLASAPISEPSPKSVNNIAPQPAVAIQPIYDTTEEAKGFLRAPFDLVAGIAKIPELALYPEELDSLAPTFKPIYDKYIVPSMGDHAPLIAFGVVFSGVAFKKYNVFRAHSQKKEMEEILRKRAQAEMQNKNPSIQHEHVV